MNEDRQRYLEALSRTHNVPLETVNLAALSLGVEEDFDELVETLRRESERQQVKPINENDMKKPKEILLMGHTANTATGRQSVHLLFDGEHFRIRTETEVKILAKDLENARREFHKHETPLRVQPV